MIVLVTGDREWTDESLVAKVLDELVGCDGIRHGDARGLDRMAGRIASGLGLRVVPYPAEWTRFGKGAGAVRNRQMLFGPYRDSDAGLPDRVIAFHDDLWGTSKGTRNMVEQAQDAGIRVTHVSHAGITELKW